VEEGGGGEEGSRKEDGPKIISEAGSGRNEIDKRTSKKREKRRDRKSGGGPRRRQGQKGVNMVTEGSDHILRRGRMVCTQNLDVSDKLRKSQTRKRRGVETQRDLERD